MRRFFIRFEKIVDAVTDCGAVAGGVLVGVMTLVVSYAVIVRYIFNRPVGWSEEISIYMMIWAIFLGTAYTFKKEAHIGVDLLVGNLPQRLQPIFYGFHYIMAMVFLAVLFYKGIGLIQLSLMLGNHSIDLNFPIFIAQLSVPVGAALLSLQVIVKFFRLFLPGESPSR